jgi:hypothetical protein
VVPRWHDREEKGGGSRGQRHMEGKIENREGVSGVAGIISSGRHRPPAGERAAWRRASSVGAMALARADKRRRKDGMWGESGVGGATRRKGLWGPGRARHVARQREGLGASSPQERRGHVAGVRSGRAARR